MTEIVRVNLDEAGSTVGTVLTLVNVTGEAGNVLIWGRYGSYCVRRDDFCPEMRVKQRENYRKIFVCGGKKFGREMIGTGLWTVLRAAAAERWSKIRYSQRTNTGAVLRSLLEAQMFGWLKRFLKRKERFDFECAWIVECGNETIRVTQPDGIVNEVIKLDIAYIMIETNDTGPWGADVWWVLASPDKAVAAVLPQGATGEPAFLDYLLGLPGFDHARMIDAMRCTENAVFNVWKRR